MESIFVVKDEKRQEQRTFWNDENLPPLPLPKLSDTLAKYLNSCKPVLTDAQYANTRSIVEKFQAGEGLELQKKLLAKSQTTRNWLDDWWLDGYLVYRGPSGYLNFSGIASYAHSPMNDQVRSCALHLHLTMKFWMLLREEKLRQQTGSGGNLFSMFQFRNLFNVCRVPRPVKDELLSYFKSVYEGSCPSHVIVFHKKRMYKIPGLCPKTGEINTPSQFYKMLLEIVQDQAAGPGIATLSDLDRGTWAEARSHLVQLSRSNEENIHDIDTAAFCLSIADQSFSNDAELLKYAMLGTSGQRWMDKFNLIVMQDGKVLIHCDHTPLDGMVVVTMMSYTDAVLHSIKNKGLDAYWGDDSSPAEKPTELKFQLDDCVERWMEKGKGVAEDIKSQVDCYVIDFDQFGRNGLKKLGRIHPCAFVQTCLQLSYMRIHGKPAPTYETGTTRNFYRGRTETLRTCTPEVVEFCKAVIHDGPDQQQLFIKACQKYAAVMEEAKAANGCDRHLLGLAEAAKENGGELPQIFQDPAFKISGGDGNFILSTSFIGYNSPATGGVTPMREDGYGAFYRIWKDSIQFLVTTFNQCPETDTKRFADHIARALADVYDLMTTSDNSRL